jgi:hypothetical protein
MCPLSAPVFPSRRGAKNALLASDQSPLIGRLLASCRAYDDPQLPASSTRRNAGSEAVKVLKTHLPKVINELLCEPTVDDVLDHMQRDLREIGVEGFGVFRFTYEGLPLEKWLLGARVEKGKVARHVRKGELGAEYPPH